MHCNYNYILRCVEYIYNIIIIYFKNEVIIDVFAVDGGSCHSRCS